MVNPWAFQFPFMHKFTSIHSFNEPKYSESETIRFQRGKARRLESESETQ
jgi:hypothetical protein